MGNCFEGQAEKEARKRSQEIDLSLKQELKNYKLFPVRLLLLGSRESDKHIIWKEMKAYCTFNEQEEEARELIQSNILRYVRDLVLACEDLELDIADRNLLIAEECKPVTFLRQPLGTVVANKIARLWADPSIKQAHQRFEEYQLCTGGRGMEYFLDSIDRFVDQFEVKHEDLMNLDLRSRGMRELNFENEKIRYKLIDVGAQRGDIRKWIHCCNNVHGVVIFAPLDEFDLYDDSENRMFQTLENFDMIVNHSCFSKSTAFILLLTRKDVFEEKNKRKDLLQQCFPYSGSKIWEACEFVREKFRSKNRSGRELYIQVNSASDYGNDLFILNSIKNSLLSIALNVF